MPTFWAKREGEYRLAVDSMASALQLARLPMNAAIRVDAKVPRNGKHHRLIWKLFSLVADALNDGPAPSAKPWTAEDVCENIKVANGYIEWLPLPKSQRKNGRTEYSRVLSISFDAMGQDEFNKFSTAAMTYIANELCPWIESSAHWPDIRMIVGDFITEETE